MVAEKNAAFVESWNSMAVESMLANQALAASFFKSFFTMSRGKKPSAVTASQLQRAALGVLGKGIAPVHRKATANAKRLARIKFR